MKDSVLFTIISGILILILLINDVIGLWGAFGLIFLLTIIGSTWYGIEKMNEQKEKGKNLEKELKQLEDFHSTKRLISPWGLIAIDENSEQIAVKEKQGSIIKLPFSEIMGCEIIEDGKTTYKKSNTFGRTIVGGIIAGGTGAIIGGLSGKEEKNKEITSLDFKILFKNTRKPSFKIRFFDAWEESANTKKSIKISDSVYGLIYRKSFDRLKDWKYIIEIILENNNKGKKSNSSEITRSISDELTKLNDLRKQGVLTDEEFEIQKRKILE